MRPWQRIQQLFAIVILTCVAEASWALVQNPEANAKIVAEAYTTDCCYYNCKEYCNTVVANAGYSLPSEGSPPVGNPLSALEVPISDAQRGNVVHINSPWHTAIIVGVDRRNEGYLTVRDTNWTPGHAPWDHELYFSNWDYHIYAIAPLDCSPAGIWWTSLPANDRWYRSNERLTYSWGGTSPNVDEGPREGNLGEIYMAEAGCGHNRYWARAWNACGDQTIDWYGYFDNCAPGASRSGGAAPNTWYNSARNVSWSASDAHSGVKRVWYRWNGTGWTESSGPASLPEGKNTLEVLVEDNAWNGASHDGNTAVSNLGQYWLDTVAPTISNVGGPSTSQWYGTPQTVTWNATDATSGIASSTLQWDTSAVTPVTPEGIHSGTITATDNAGNSKTQAVGPYWVDLTAPAVAVVLNPTQPDGDNGWYKTTPSASVTADDGAGSGVAGIFYTLDGSEFPYTSAVSIPEGPHSLSGRAVDLVGHSGITPPIPVSVDTAPPVITDIATDAQSYSLTTLVAAWSGNDSASGIAEYRYRVGTAPGSDDTKPETSNGAGTNAYITGLSLANGGTYYVSVRARDNAGHWCDWISSLAVTVFAGEGREDSPNLNAGGVSVPAEARRSENYMVVDSVAQFAVDVSYSGNYVVQSGYWHPEEGTSFLGAYDSPNFNAGGVSGDVVRISENYRLVDSIAQFAVETSTSEGFIVESGLWHSDRSYTEIDLMRVLAITAGIDEASSDDLAHYDTVGGSSAGKLDIADACAVARKVAGLEANP